MSLKQALFSVGLREFQGAKGRARKKVRKTRGPQNSWGGACLFLYIFLVLLAFLLGY